MRVLGRLVTWTMEYFFARDVERKLRDCFLMARCRDDRGIFYARGKRDEREW